MGERTSYPPGTFSWAELATSDSGAAKAFYTAVLGWDYDDNDMGEQGVYTIVLRDGKTVGALYQEADQPPHWNCYLTVASADDTTAKARDGGANVVMEPFDVMELGRMSVIADPTGAALALWEPRQNIGAELVNAPGALTWNDLVTGDAATATAFYGDVFGWTFDEIPNAGGYQVIRNGGRANGGVMSQDGPSYWVPYFGHEDVDRAVEEIPGLGGKVLAGPVRMPQGSIGVFADPHGAVFSLWTGQYED
jgi:uncharacterized protein